MAEDGRDKTIRELIAQAERDNAAWVKERARLVAALERAKPYLFNAPLEGALDAWEQVCNALNPLDP